MSRLRPPSSDRILSRVLAALVLSLGFSWMGYPQSGAPAAEPRRFAILVGINQYADPGLVTLQKAQNDAEDLGKVLSRLGGYKVVTVMSGSLPFGDMNFPSRNKILERVETLAGILKPEDQVLFFFSGHGVNDKGGNSYILPIDAQVKDPIGTGIELQADIARKFEAAGVKNVLFLIDACQKTVVKDKGLTVVGIDQVRGGSAVVITATDKGKASYEDPNGANGLFTRGILTALAGQADFNKDGLVSVAELSRYLPEEVSEYAFSVGKSQKPAVFDPGTGALQPPIARVGTKPAPEAGPAGPAAAVPAAPTAKVQFVSFRVPEGVRVDIRLLGSDGRELKVWPDTASMSEKLEPGSYRIEAQDRNYLYYPFSASFSVADAKITVPLELKPNFGSLTLACDPAEGVEVILNGEKRGVLSGSALTIDRLKSGSYELVLSRELYDTRRQTIRIEDGKTASVKVSLNPNYYTLELSTASGAAARLFIDGRDRGALPLSVRLPFRDTVIRVVPADGRYKEWTDTIRPAAKGGTEKRVAGLAGRMGILELTTTPDAEAEVTLTPADGGAAVKAGTAPLDYEALVGDYEVSASALVGGKRLSAKARVIIREGQVSPLRLELREAAAPAPTSVSAAASAPPERVPGKSFRGEIFVQGGTFRMGSETGNGYEKPVHSVTVSSFWMMRTEVTVGSFRDFVKAEKYLTTAEKSDWTLIWTGKDMEKKPDASWKNPYFVQEDQSPVVLVSWYDAVAYANWLSVKDGLKPAYRISGTSVEWDRSADGWRLPTEAEWEYAARGGASSRGYTYAGGNDLGSVGWYSDNSGSKTQPVGKKAPNELGLYDLSGNVWEWCWDWDGEYGGASQTDPTGAASGEYRVLRGSCWANPAWSLAVRGRYHRPDTRANYLGFRLVRPQVR